MCAGEGESCVGAVIEVQLHPAVRAVALRAVGAQRTLVDVHVAVTGNAVLGSLAKSLARVALSACNDGVKSQQGESRLVVIECNVRPFRVGVTVIAPPAQRLAVRLVRAMTIDAVRAEFCGCGFRRMTGMAIERCMRSGQCKPEAARVIEVCDLPCVLAVAVCAGGPEAAGVPVVGLMTPATVLRYRRVQITGTVTIGASDASVSPVQCETRLTGVIESLSGPALRGMAVFALSALAAAMNVIRCMASRALRRYSLVSLAEVTRRARRVTMFSHERIPRRVMVEVGLRPGALGVAGGALGAQCSPMDVGVPMAVRTDGRRLPVGTGRFVAGDTVERQVRALQRKPREIVLEPGGVELVHVRRPPVMLRVTAPALTGRRVRHPAVITSGGTDVRGDFLMTRKTQGALTIAVGAVVTVVAVRFQARVGLRNGAGHDELLDRRGMNGWRQRQQKGRDERCRARPAHAPRFSTRARRSRARFPRL